MLISLSLVACKKDEDDNSPSSGSQTQQTQTVNLQVDDFTGGAVAFQSSFIAGEYAAVTLGPIANTFQITYVKFLLGGSSAPETKDINLKIYVDEGDTDPATLLFNSTFSLTSSNSVWQEIDLRNNNLIINGGGSIRIALDAGDGLPSVAEDSDGTIEETKNWIYTGGAWTI